MAMLARRENSSVYSDLKKPGRKKRNLTTGARASGRSLGSVQVPGGNRPVGLTRQHLKRNALHQKKAGSLEKFLRSLRTQVRNVRGLGTEALARSPRTKEKIQIYNYKLNTSMTQKGRGCSVRGGRTGSPGG